MKKLFIRNVLMALLLVSNTLFAEDAADSSKCDGGIRGSGGMGSRTAAALTNGTIQILERDGHQIYTSSLRLPPGEIVYLACEPLFSMERVACWYQYGVHANAITHVVTRTLSDSMKDDGTYDKERQNAIIQKEIPGNTLEQRLFGTLLDQIGDKRKGCKLLSDISIGASTMLTMLEIGGFVAYISKSPITGFCLLPSLPLDGGLIDGMALFKFSGDAMSQLQCYIEQYSHILMCVSSCAPPKIAAVPSHIDRRNTYENRGIFRNPLSMIDGDYKGLAVPLHAFTGKVWLSKHPGMEYLLVKPDRMVVMRNLIIATFKGHQIVKCEDGAIGVRIEALNEKYDVLAIGICDGVTPVPTLLPVHIAS